MSKILVIGSYNVGLWVVGPRIPKPGETVLGDSFDMGPGGKGSNQAIAIARLGGDVVFLAKVGNDIFGREALAMYEREGMTTKYIKIDPSAKTGAGIIFIDANGQNAIGVAPGANCKLSSQDLDEAGDLFTSCRVVLMQLETPVETMKYAARKARRAEAVMILNPAPAQRLDTDVLSLIGIITPNETEAEILTGQTINSVEDAYRAGRILLERGVKMAIITLGEKGCVYVDGAREKHYPASAVKAIDTTGAGDAFNGGLAFALANGWGMDAAIRFASQVGAFSVTRMGVVPGLPRRADLESFFGKDRVEWPQAE